MYKIIQNRKMWYILSAIFIVPGILSLFVWGLRFGIDFAGGSLLEVDIIKQKDIGTDQIRNTLTQKKVENLAVQSSGKNQFLIRYRKAAEIKQKDDQFAETLTQQLSAKVGETKQIRFENVGPIVSQSLVKKSVISIIIASILLLVYIGWAFRGVPTSVPSWKWGLFAIVALIHDLLFVIGLFSILGHFLPTFEVNTMFITALLTILGYSINDTIIIYDRIRENLRRMPGRGFEEVANAACNQTLARSLNTSLTMFFVLLALTVLGGSTLISFSMALLLGTFIGTYSSIFVASPLLVTFQNRK